MNPAASVEAADFNPQRVFNSFALLGGSGGAGAGTYAGAGSG